MVEQSNGNIKLCGKKEKYHCETEQWEQLVVAIKAGTWENKATETQSCENTDHCETEQWEQLVLVIKTDT